MTTELTCGLVPSMYREFYNVVCSNENDVCDRKIFVGILSGSGLSRQILLQVWDAVDNKENSLNRTGLYRALALVALAQQGKSVNIKLLDNYSDQELPKPDLGELSDLRTLSYIVRQERFPAALGYTYREMCDLDTVLVTYIPEKKGLILKHVEYEVTSQRWQTVVLRRYSDFVSLQEMLLIRFPYRIIPRLPPKKVIGTEGRDFIEQRRRALQRFLAVITRHPTISNEQIVKYFFTFKGSELHCKIKEHFRAIPDEFMTSQFAVKAKELISCDSLMEFAKSRDHVKSLIDALIRVRCIAEHLLSSACSQAFDMQLLSKELSAMSSDTTLMSSWACGSNENWKLIKTGLLSVIPEFTGVINTLNVQAARLEERFADVIGTLLEILLAYKDLCDRHDKGVLTDHQKTLHKLSQLRKKNSTALHSSAAEQPGAMEKLEARILEQESEIMNVENRSAFAIYCLQMETQLVYASMEGLHEALKNLVDDERVIHSELAGAWAQICPLFGTIFPSGMDCHGMSKLPSTVCRSLPAGYNISNDSKSTDNKL